MASVVKVKGVDSEESTSSQFDIQGMTCAACVRRIENALSKVDGVDEAVVNLATEKARVTGNFSTKDILKAVEKAGYSATPADEKSTSTVDWLKKRLIVSAIISVPFLVEMIFMLLPGGHHLVESFLPFKSRSLVFFLLATIIQFGPGFAFYKHGIAAFRALSPDMNSLVMIGTSAAYLYSVVATFWPQILPENAVHVYYEASVFVITLILLGKYLEGVAKGRAGSAIKKLLSLSAKSAHVLRQDQEFDLPVEQLQLGDFVLVRPGERIPTDGIITNGRATIDESMITGESIPVVKTEGSNVVGGSINTTGAFTFRVTHLGKDTLLSQIIRMVDEAQTSKPPIQALADQVVAYFVPVVLGIATITFFVWLFFGPPPALAFALVNAVAVLIIACPCALGLATPVSIMVGSGKAASLGVVFRKGSAFETLARASVIAFDKTGTLTEGKPRVKSVLFVNGGVASEILQEEQKVSLQLIGSAEKSSEHPLARSIVEYAMANNVTLEIPVYLQAEVGKGITASVQDRTVQVGSFRYMETIGVDIPQDVRTKIAEFSTVGQTPVLAAIDGILQMVFGIADPIRKTSEDAILALQKLGLKTVLISGDVKPTAEVVANQLHIDEVYAEVLPSQKQDIVKRLQASGQKVVFVGDGVNDAPALAAADSSIAIGKGSDVAIETAEVILLSDDLLGVVNAIRIGRGVLRNIKQNLFWAFFYNVILIPAAAGVLYPLWNILLSPVLAASAMGLSSLFVLTNALALKRFKASHQGTKD